MQLFSKMENKYKEYKGLDLVEIADRTLKNWQEKDIFNKSVISRPEHNPFVFYEGPPSANGLPGIHHVMARAIKDIFCRYKTLKGFRVERKAGWDTHGLPIELGVEKELGITKEDIGTKISVKDYNDACRKAVMRYTDVWNDLTQKMGYWVDMENPYVTYETKYMETVWWLLKQLHQKDLLYKGYTIQPYSPAAGTGLSSHEINQPGCYKEVKDTSIVAQFKLSKESKANFERIAGIAAHFDVYFLAWTTTPWTLPSNTALTVGPKIDYVLVETYNPYTNLPIAVILAKNLVANHFSGKFYAVNSHEDLQNNEDEKKTPFHVIAEFKGADLKGLRYEQLIPFAKPYKDAEKAFQVITGDFVTTEDGTGIVHTAPTFGADDAKVAAENGIPALLVLDENDNTVPLVNLKGKFIDGLDYLSGKYVKNEYYKEEERPEQSVDVEIAIHLKEQNLAFKVEKYAHNYPHCWRTDKPVLYYPLDSWFIKSTAVKSRMIELNKTIQWKPESTGTGRFGNWLENLNDWNLSRSRYWGVPLPIWRTEDKKEEVCIGSLEQLKAEIAKSLAAGFMTEDPLKDFVVNDFSKENYEQIDIHKHYVDSIVLCSDSGQAMKRESDLIDVWFDSGSMPYAQYHYPFENKDKIDNKQTFPADFIAEGVDQTRGWFFTLHAISTLVFDSVAYKNVVSNGLVLDKNGQKMSQRLGNATDPFTTLSKYGADATRWYMLGNAQPWENLRFDEDGIDETRKKFFGTLYNTYSFFVLYANIDNFAFSEAEYAAEDKTELDRWVISLLHSLIKEVEEAFNDYEPTKAIRAIQTFVTEDLSNWFVRLSRRRFWKGEYSQDKIVAYQTLYQCLETVSILASPVAPFFMDELFCNLNNVSQRNKAESVHLADFPIYDEKLIDKQLEMEMSMAQSITSLILSIRKKEKIKVRQPLSKVLIPALNDEQKTAILKIKDLVLSEVNVKEVQIVDGSNNLITKKAKANFSILGKKAGKSMKELASKISAFTAEEISNIETSGEIVLEIDENPFVLLLQEIEIVSEDIPGWQVASDGQLTVALDITLTEELLKEGQAREIVNKLQNLRKQLGMEVTDKIIVTFNKENIFKSAINEFKEYICAEILCKNLNFNDNGSSYIWNTIEIDETNVEVSIEKTN